MKRIISVDGGKGGVGKSIIAMACLDTALTAGKKPLLIECDTTNPDVYKAYGEIIEAHAIELTDKSGFLALASALHETNAEIVVINNPAGSNGWRTHGRLIADNLGRIGGNLCTLWVANRQQDALEILTSYHEVLPDVPVFFVMNLYWGTPSSFEIWQNSKLRMKFFQCGGGEICFPDCADRVMHQIRTERLRWDQINSLPFGNLIEAERVRRLFTEILSPIIMK